MLNVGDGEAISGEGGAEDFTDVGGDDVGDVL